MKIARIGLFAVLFLTFLLTMPYSMAQEDEEETTANEDICILTSFCGVILFILFLIYVSSKKRSNSSINHRTSGSRGYPPRQPGYRTPMPHTYPPPRKQMKAPLPQHDVKCDLCGSKNLRTFEGGYFKCTDCRHVFYHTESSRRRR